jgi:hypothetical protein
VRPTAPKLFVAIIRQTYIQFAAVTGALSLAGLLSHVIEWEGVLLGLVNWWAETVRPIVHFVYAPLVGLFEFLLKVDLTIPPVVEDYLAVGLVLILSRWRGAAGGWKGGTTKAARNLLRRPLGALLLLLRTLFAWPVELTVLTANALFARRRFPDREDAEIRQIRISHLIALLPVFYAVALVLGNWVLALFPSLIARPAAPKA